MIDRFKRTFPLALLVLVNLAFAGSSPVPSSPPNICEIRQAVWCLYNGAEKIVDVKPGFESTDTSIWYVHGVLSPEKPLIILEPRGCRTGLSDDIKLVSFDSSHERDKKKWNKLVVRLKKDNSCDIVLLSPTKEDDPIAEAFANGLTLIQACSSSDCKGDVLGKKITLNDLNQYKSH